VPSTEDTERLVDAVLKVADRYWQRSRQHPSQARLRQEAWLFAAVALSFFSLENALSRLMPFEYGANLSGGANMRGVCLNILFENVWVLLIFSRDDNDDRLYHWVAEPTPGAPLKFPFMMLRATGDYTYENHLSEIRLTFDYEQAVTNLLTVIARQTGLPVL
jgi:hypothetical protein